MEHKDPIILDFSGDVTEALNLLESILYTSGWNNHIRAYLDTPNEDKLLFSLIREGAIAVGEVYYTFTRDIPEDIQSRANKYFHRLRKREIDSIYLNAVNYFSRHEPDIEKTDNGALFYPAISAFVRCGNLSPQRLLELMQTDGCERVIVFGSGLRYDKEQPWEVFRSFEMRAPKEYILQKLNDLQEERMQHYFAVSERSEAKEMFPTVSDKEK